MREGFDWCDMGDDAAATMDRDLRMREKDGTDEDDLKRRATAAISDGGEEGFYGGDLDCGENGVGIRGSEGRMISRLY